MNKAVKLLNEWDKFEQEFPQGSIEDFCRHYLSQQHTGEEADIATSRSRLLLAMGRINSAFNLYQRAAMSNTSLPFADGFYYLNGLAFLGESRKTDLINFLLVEYTTGMEAISKLLMEGFVQARPDETDGRARLISLTDKGLESLKECYYYISKAGEMIFDKMEAGVTRLCMQELEPIERRHAALAVELKGKSFEEMFNHIVNNA